MRPVTLIHVDSALQAILARGPEDFEARYHATLGRQGELVREVVRQSLAFFPSADDEPVWSGFLAVDEVSGTVVGSCAFKGPPSADGTVEIAYFTFPEFERSGFGTAMAAKLVEIALTANAVNAVIAHTLPERNASTRILEKIGMRLLGEILDPEDGTVWRWELSSGR
ncbi:N-acetyltransferase [Sulfurifustis variabilis]|uniref:N-acetyltransferase n=1 Tax=Sulfurifustis variabilis TaxID=1675686 RepID=A0A1B4V7Z9_9GAMM|nr:GNAT family N-acetyltransferase [Sulfurifustis variabilis]BAU48762.1 N-acetyltransferase [Sulfurifustis variabilis]